MDTGNLFSTPYVWSRQGDKVKESYLTRFYRQVGYQAVALGWGDLRTVKMGGGRGLPWVSANVEAQGVRPYRLVRVGTWRVAITGVTGKGSFSSSMDWKDPSRALNRVLKGISRNRVDLVLLLMASPADSRALTVGGFQVVLGGVYGRGKMVKKGPPYVFWLRRPKGGQVGVVTLEKTTTGVKLVSFRAYTLDSRIPGDPQVMKELKGLK